MSAVLPAVSVRELRTVFIHNPVSGRASARGHRRDRVAAFIARHGLNATLVLTTHRGHAPELARTAIAEGAQLVVSVGGDGTMNEVASGILGSSALYGMIPTGSGNGLGRDLGLPMDFDRALDVLLDGRVRTIDTGEAAGYPFFNVMGLGFDAEIGRRFNATEGRGLFNYLQIGLRAFFAYRKETVTVTPAGAAPFGVEAFLASVANSTQYGNNARIAPRARLDDGQLDFVALTTGNPVLALPMVVRLFTGSMHRSRYARGAVAARFRLQRAAPGPIHTDGEIHDAPAEFEVVVRPRSLRVIVPPGTNG
jgi:YegS/Rv2252/BmrU family lipid kinase